MIDLIFVLFLLALFHFIYESILAPSLRMSLRFRLFALRDQLRSLKMEHSEEMDDKHFHSLQDSINGLLAVLFMVDLSMLLSAEQAYKYDCDFRRRVDRRSAILDDCAISAVKEIRGQSLWIIVGAIVANSGAFLLTVSPLVLVCILAGKGISGTKSRIRKFASLSEEDYQKIAPQNAVTASLI